MNPGFRFNSEDLKGGHVEGLSKFCGWCTRTNKIKILAGVVVELWFTNSHLLTQRKNMLAVWHDFYTRFQDQLTHYQKNNANSLSRLTSGFPTHFEEIVNELGEDEYFDGAFWGKGDRKKVSGEAAYWFISGLGDTNITGGDTNTSIRANMPIQWLLNNPQAFIEMIIEWCETLGSVHGSAGAGLIFDQSGASKRVYQQGAPIANRFPGLDYPNSPYFGLNSSKGKAQKRGIRCVNWLTVFDNSYIAELGGLKNIREGLDNDILVHEFNGGAVIQAGELPEIGDVDHGIWPEAYRKVNNVIKPIRFEDYGNPYIFVSEPLDGLDETLKWVRRFDHV